MCFHYLMAPAERFSAFYCLQSLPEVTHLGECLHTKTASERYFSSAWQGGVCLELLGQPCRVFFSSPLAPENEPGRGSCKRSLFVMGTKMPVMLCKAQMLCYASMCQRSISKPCCFSKPVSWRAGAPKVLAPHLPVAQSDARGVSKNRNTGSKCQREGKPQYFHSINLTVMRNYQAVTTPQKDVS